MFVVLKMLNKKTKMKNIVKILIGITTMALVACGGSGEKSNEKSSLTGNVKVDGSSTVYPITEAVAEEFRSVEPGVNVTVGVSGTGGGFKKFMRGEIDINDASRPIKSKEADACAEIGIDFVELSVAYDGLAVLVNPENDWVDYFTVEELEKIYPLSSSLYSEDEEFRESALQINKKLNESDKETIQQWSVIRQVSIKSITQVLEILGHKFDLILGESDVNYLIPEMLESLLEKKKITEDSGAYVASLDTDPKILITKSDGSYLYLTTDLATVINRKSQNFDTVLYVVDKRQSLHFNQLFQCVEYFGIDNADFQHIAFGTVNDSLGNPFKTREGGTKKLIDLFDETKDYIKDINKKLSDSTVNILANTILTYSDLITNRKTDYKFDLEKFSNISGKTGIYVQYALVRAKTLFHKSDLKIKKQFYTTKLDEKDLSLIHSLMKFEIYFEQSLNNSEPHHLADYLYELSNLYNSMYQSDNILENNDKEITNNKLLITSYFIDYSILLMESLGISPVDKM